MPLHDFRCRACGHEFEALVRSTDSDPPHCRACGGRDLEQLLSTFAVSSEERTKAAATVARSRAARTARRDNAAADREAEAHRLEDF